MECDDLFEMDGIRLGYTEDTVTITEIDYGSKAVLDNHGNILSSDFSDQFIPFIKNYFWSNYSMVVNSREIDRKYSDA